MFWSISLVLLGFLPPFFASVVLFRLWIRVQQNLAQAELQKQALEIHLQRNEQHFQEKLQDLEKARAETRTEVDKTLKALCADALQANNRSFLDLAGTVLENFKASTNQTWATQHKTMADLVTPITQSLGTMDQKIQDLEKVRLGAYEGLKLQITDLITTQRELRQQTGSLVSALRTPHVRGRWGELQLRRVVEISGMIAHCDFDEQVTGTQGTDKEKRGRPDLVVKLPGGRCIAVDAKVPLNSYLDALEATDEQLREAKMKEHARHVRQHIKELSARAYWEQFQPTPELVVLFLPGEVFFSAALEHDPLLLEHGADAQVILATPTTLIALLKAISFGWRQEKLAENAEAIRTMGQEIYRRLSDLNTHFSHLGRHLGSAVNAYNQTVGSLEHRVLPTARRFESMGLISKDNGLPPSPFLDHQQRTITAKELLPQ